MHINQKWKFFTDNQVFRDRLSRTIIMSSTSSCGLIARRRYKPKAVSQENAYSLPNHTLCLEYQLLVIWQCDKKAQQSETTWNCNWQSFTKLFHIRKISWKKATEKFLHQIQLVFHNFKVKTLTSSILSIIIW